LKAVQIVDESGPDTALKLVDVPEPEPSHPFTPGSGVLVDVRAAGVSFPELLQSRGQYQFKPPLPFVPGSEVGGVVRSAPEDAAVKAGDRVAAFCMLGGFAEVVAAPAYFTFKLPDELSYEQGASLVLNYHTAYFALKLRGRLSPGETVLVHGAAGGVGSAAIQVGRALGARVIAVVSSDRKEDAAARLGADVCVRAGSGWLGRVLEASPGGVDAIFDPVAGVTFDDSVRALAPEGRLVIIGFAGGGSIPTLAMNRVLFRNIDVVGAGWGAFLERHPEIRPETHDDLLRMVAGGFIAPLVGAELPLERAAEALRLIGDREAVGKVVLTVREEAR
jgi:NADPH2:quinone reductase